MAAIFLAEVSFTLAAMAAKASFQLGGLELAAPPALKGAIQPLARESPSQAWRALSEIHSSFTSSLRARQYPHHLRPAGIDADVAALRIHHIDAFGLCAIPRALH